MAAAKTSRHLSLQSQIKLSQTVKLKKRTTAKSELTCAGAVMMSFMCERRSSDTFAKFSIRVSCFNRARWLAERRGHNTLHARRLSGRNSTIAFAGPMRAMKED